MMSASSRRAARYQHRTRVSAASHAQIALAALLGFAIAGALSSPAFSQNTNPGGTNQKKDDQNKDQKKDDSKKTDPKKGDQKKGAQGAQPAPFTPINCVIVVQYNPDRGDKDRKIAFNDDLMKSAKAVGANLGKDETELKEVNAGAKFPAVLASFKKDKKCCKRIEIIAHGDTDGSLDLPYENDGAKDMSDQKRKDFGYDTVGGPKAKARDPDGGKFDGATWLKNFAANLKAALCPEEKKPKIVFDGCYSAKDGGIADQIHTATGAETQGYTGTCDFPHDEDTGQGELPKPREGGTSEERKFGSDEGEGGGMLIPGKPGEGTPVYYVSTDGGRWCTYGDRTAVATTLTPTDANGVPVAVVTTASTADAGGAQSATTGFDRRPQSTEHTATVADRVPADRPPASHDQPPPITADNPPTTTAGNPPPTTTDVIPPATDTPSSNIPDTVIVKANQVVLAGGPTGTELQDQTVKLTFAKPDLPGTGQTKTARDTGFDRNPAQCTTGGDGQCTLNVDPDERALYGLASTPGKPGHYRLDLNLLKHNGAVAETTGKRAVDLKNAAPAGGKLAATEFRIGNRKFTRLAIDQPYGRDQDLGAVIGAVGVAVKTDYCRTKKPGPPLGPEPASLSSLNHELPETTLKIQHSVDTQRGVR